MKRNKVREKYTGLPVADSATVSVQINQVTQHLFTGHNAEPTVEFSSWEVTDGIFEASKTSYEEVLNAYLEVPQTFRLETVRQRLLASHLSAKCIKEDATNVAASIDESNADSDDGELEGEGGEYLDPYALPRGVEAHLDRHGRTVYLDTVTRETLAEAPQVWERKVDMLRSLALRPDGEGFMHRESEEDTRRRLRCLSQHATRGQAELRRRQTRPTDAEALEDAVQALVDGVVGRVRRERRRELRRRCQLGAEYRHVACLGHPLSTTLTAGLSGPSHHDITDVPVDMAGATLYAAGVVLPSNMAVDMTRVRSVIVTDAADDDGDTPTEKRRSTATLPLETRLRQALADMLYLPLSCVEIDEVGRLDDKLAEQYTLALAPTTPTTPMAPTALASVLPPLSPLLQSTHVQSVVRELGSSAARAVDLVFDTNFSDLTKPAPATHTTGAGRHLLLSAAAPVSNSVRAANGAVKRRRKQEALRQLFLERERTQAALRDGAGGASSWLLPSLVSPSKLPIPAAPIIPRRKAAYGVAFTLYVSDTLRSADKRLADLTSEDFALTLKETVLERGVTWSLGNKSATVPKAASVPVPVVGASTGTEAQFVSLSHTWIRPGLPFTDWPGYYTHFIHPAFFGYSVETAAPTAVPAEQTRSRNVSETPSSSSTTHHHVKSSDATVLSPTEYLSAGGLVALGALGGATAAGAGESSLSAGVRRQGRLDPRSMHMADMTAAKVEALRQHLVAAEHAYAAYIANKRSTMRGVLSREEYRVLERRDTAARMYASAKRYLAQQEHEVVVPMPALAAGVDFTLLDEEEEQGAGHIQHAVVQRKQRLVRRRQSMYATRAIREREKALRDKVSAQRAFLVRTLAAEYVMPSRMEAELAEALRRMEVARQHADAERDPAESALEESRRAVLARTEATLTRQLFRVLLAGMVAEHSEGVMLSDAFKRSYQTGAVVDVSCMSSALLLEHLRAALEEVAAAAQQVKARVREQARRVRDKAMRRRQSQLKDIRRKSMARFAASFARPLKPDELGDSEDSSASDSSDEDNNKSKQAHNKADLTTKEEPELHRLLRQLHWPVLVCGIPAFRSCLLQLPTIFPHQVSEDELVQFGSLCVELEPPYTAACKAISATITAAGADTNAMLPLHTKEAS